MTTFSVTFTVNFAVLIKCNFEKVAALLCFITVSDNILWPQEFVNC